VITINLSGKLKIQLLLSGEFARLNSLFTLG